VVFREAFPLVFSFAPLAVLTSGVFLLLARNTGRLGGGTKTLVRVVGAVSAIMALNGARMIVPTVTDFEPGWVMLLLQTAFLFFVAGAAWWPDSRRSPAA